MPSSASTTAEAATPARTSMRCSRRIFFTLASRSGTSRIVYDLSKEPPGGWYFLTQTRRARDYFPVRCEPRASLPPTRAAVQYWKVETLVNGSGEKKRALGYLAGDMMAGAGAPHHRVPLADLFNTLDRDDRDVVVAAAFVGQLDQFLRHDVQLVLEQRVADLFVLHQIREPVGAEQELVAGPGLDADHVDQHVLFEPDRAG